MTGNIVLGRATELSMTRRFNWKLFVILWLAGTLSAAAVLPYLIRITGGAGLPTTDLGVLIPRVLLQNGIVFAIVVAAGLWLANRTGLGAPILERWLNGEPVGSWARSALGLAIVLGVMTGLVIVGLDILVFGPLLSAEAGSASALALNFHGFSWEGFLASFYGGIGEELFSRLVVVSLLAFIGKFLSHTPEGRPTRAVLWAATIIAAVIFGLGHLPTTSVIVSITPLVVTRAVVLNGIAGVVFGYLYWSRGLESAIVAHFFGDLVIHVWFG